MKVIGPFKLVIGLLILSILFLYVFSKVVDYLPVFYTGKHHAYMQPPATKSMFQFLLPFSMDLWITVFVALIIFAVSWFVITNAETIKYQPFTLKER